MIFDSHAHYCDPRYDEDRDLLLAAMPDAGVGRLFMPGSSLDDQEKIIQIAAGYDFIYAGAGIHPHHSDATKEDLDKLEGYLQQASAHKIVAVGECGLDTFAVEGYPPPDRDAQRALFDAQLCLAGRYDLPVVVHDRDAHEDCLDLIRAHPGNRTLFHCFSGDAGLAKTLCGMGIYISFSGMLTYKKNTELRGAAAAVPDEFLLIETDAPYLAPEPLRGKRCDSTMIPHILHVLAEARGQTVEDVERLTWDNAVRFFGLA
ncbi:MAG: TatD family hydrolase [Oscillospiraceae bacterium]|nr:TatD family hydrolase [Oscillospiraceae bacterium]